jgi:hypothetical protein
MTKGGIEIFLRFLNTLASGTTSINVLGTVTLRRRAGVFIILVIFLGDGRLLFEFKA